MRRKEDRTSQILELLVKEKKLEVAELSAHLGVSQVTVRKDLDAMEAQGLITREHGFAVLSSTDDIKGRLAYHYEEKKKIALRAAELVKDGDTIMIESGSCCALLAAALAELRTGITIITNSAFIADYIRRSSDFQIVLLGGIYQQDAQVMVGPILRTCAESFYASKLFVGIDGFHENGVMGNNLLRSEAARTMAEHAQEVIILTESSKFTRPGVVSLFPLEHIQAIYTDEQIEAGQRDYLKDHHIDLHIV
jgi:DeoR/GlpR family transcriptional regulator of sugar metabolism